MKKHGTLRLPNKLALTFQNVSSPLVLPEEDAKSVEGFSFRGSEAANSMDSICAPVATRKNLKARNVLAKCFLRKMA